MKTLKTSQLKRASAILWFFILFIGCKKQATTPPPNSNQPPDPTQINGLFEAQRNMVLSDTAIGYDYVFRAAVSDSLYKIDQLTGLAAGNISLNNHPLNINPYNPPLTDYFLSITNINFDTLFNWQVSGSANISAFSFTNQDKCPYYSGFKTLPDSININTPLSFSVSNYYGANKIEVSISLADGSNSTPAIAFAPSPIPTEITYTRGNLYSLFTQNPFYNEGVINIIFYKDHFQTINNHVYNFRTILFFRKTILLLNT